MQHRRRSTRLTPTRSRRRRTASSMRARNAVGDPAGVHRALDACRAALAELGVEPAPETVALA